MLRTSQRQTGSRRCGEEVGGENRKHAVWNCSRPKRTSLKSQLSRERKLTRMLHSSLSLIFSIKHPVSKLFTECLTIQTVQQKLALFPAWRFAGRYIAGNARISRQNIRPECLKKTVTTKLENHQGLPNIWKCAYNSGKFYTWKDLHARFQANVKTTISARPNRPAPSAILVVLSPAPSK